MPSGEKALYEQGYRAGVKEQMEDIASKFQGGQFPYYHWAAPIVQEVKVPAHIEKGVFMAEHQELVLIKPGQWQQSPAYPIATTENKGHDKQTNDSTTVSNITALP